MNEFYVYIYLDPRKPGTFTYGDYTFDYEPFYVGKGRGYRSLMTIQNSKDLNNKSHKFNKIRKIIKECNREPVVVKIDKNLSEDYSFQLEIWTIWAIGRYDLGTGPLTNLTDGGEGTTNISKETRIKKSNSKRDRKKIHYAQGKNWFYQYRYHGFSHGQKSNERRLSTYSL